MTAAATTIQTYLDTLPPDRKEAITQLREVIRKHLPDGFQEGLYNGMVCYAVPHSRYPAGYHVNPKQPLPFISIASQKNFIAVHHMGLYTMPQLLQWFQQEYPRHSKKKLDMGKGCIRFKNPAEIPFALMGELAQKVTPDEWIQCYENIVKDRRSKSKENA